MAKTTVCCAIRATQASLKAAMTFSGVTAWFDSNRYAALISSWVLKVCGTDPPGFLAIACTIHSTRAERRASVKLSVSNSARIHANMLDHLKHVLFL
ncbi:MAG: hypothetical protein NTW87_31810 [Planctomycetota bacterium]|nr:hypothetical protein [Planctomycetota bacterium]